MDESIALPGQPVNNFVLPPDPDKMNPDSDSESSGTTYSSEQVNDIISGSFQGVLDLLGRMSGDKSSIGDVIGNFFKLNEDNDTPQDALSQLHELAKTDPAYKEMELQLMAERENQQAAWDWYEKFNGTYYQRTTKDLEAAGLNPWLALQSLGSGGSGSTSPAGTWSGSSGSTLSAKQQEMKNDLDKQALSSTIGFVAAIIGALIIALV